MFYALNGGLVSVPSTTDHLLVLVKKRLKAWRLMAIYQEPLPPLSLRAKKVPIALAMPSEQLIHWTEEFPAHLSQTAIFHYVQHSKADLLAKPTEHLTLHFCPKAHHSQQVLAWVWNEPQCQRWCQPYQQLGLTIAALEPIDYVRQRAIPLYQDPKGLSHSWLDQSALHLALKLACRHDWVKPWS